MKKIFAITVLIVAMACHRKSVPAAGSAGGGSTTSTSDRTAITPPAPVAPAAAGVPGQEGSKTGGASKGDVVMTKEMKGQSTFNAKCGTCHGLKVTTDYTAARWETIMVLMSNYAKLSEEEKENVLAFVKTNAKK